MSTEKILRERASEQCELCGSSEGLVVHAVKGANFTAKRGTAVRDISLVADNEAQIEGRVNGQRIVILTKFVKKSG